MQLYNDYLNKKNERALAEIGEAEREELRGKTAFADRIDRRNIFFKYTHWELQRWDFMSYIKGETGELKQVFVQAFKQWIH